MTPEAAVTTEILLHGNSTSSVPKALRASAYRIPGAGFTAFVTTRPVLWQGAPSAMVVVRPLHTPDSHLLDRLSERLEGVEFQRNSAGEATAFFPWERRGQLEEWLAAAMRAGMPVPGQHDPDSAPADLFETGSAELSGEGGASSLSGLGTASQPPRYSRTEDGGRARRTLVTLANMKPGLLQRLTTQIWRLPGISIKETVRLRVTTWRLDFENMTAEQWFLARCQQLPPSVEQSFEADGDGDGEGMTVIEAILLSAPAADAKARQQLAAVLWDLLNDLWMADQRQAMLRQAV